MNKEEKITVNSLWYGTALAYAQLFCLALEKSDDEVRSILLRKLKEEVCLDCGRRQPENRGQSCQCWNDE